MSERTEEYVVKTPHYKFKLNVTENYKPSHKMSFLVGNPSHPCLEGFVLLPDIDPRLRHLIDTATLTKVDALQECSMNEINSSYLERHSFGIELIYSYFSIIVANYPHVKYVSLSDMSYIPCNRSKNDTLDMLSYYIALYGKTWYESKLNAYLPNSKDANIYIKEIEKYMSTDGKNISFIDLYGMISVSNTFAEIIIKDKYQDYETMYETSVTLPEFFNRLNKTIRREDKCKFFKGWLETFINSRVRILRQWQINLYDNPVLIESNVVNISKRIPMGHHTRKMRRKV